jgi:DNA-binding transcriptional MerR regulator
MNVRISEAARQLGVHPSTLRNLEKRGVITTQRDWAGYRVYTESEIHNISKILFPEKKLRAGGR